MTAPEDSGEHRTFEDMAVAHVLGGLDADQARVFRSHLLDCGDCRARVGELRAIAHDLATVERTERRERSASANSVETKNRRQVDVASPPTPQRSGAYRVLVFAVLAGFVALVAYTAMLRSNVVELEQAVEVQRAASATLEHGTELPVEYKAPGVTATAKVHEAQLVLLLEGLQGERAYGLYLVDDRPDDADLTMRVLYRGQALVGADGRLLVPLPLSGAEDRVIVTDPRNGFSSQPDGEPLFEARISEEARPEDTEAESDEPREAEEEPRAQA